MSENLSSNMCWMNVKPFHIDDVGGIEFEKNRHEEEDMSKYNNLVHKERIKDNVYFKKTDNWEEYLNDYYKQYEDDFKIKSNSRVCCNIVVRCSKDWLESHTKEQQLEYFKKAYDWFNDNPTFNGVNIDVFNAVVHYDEDDPHLELTCTCVEKDVQKTVMVDEKDENGNCIYYPKKPNSKRRTKKRKQVNLEDEYGNPVKTTRLGYKNFAGSPNKLSILQTLLHKHVGQQFGLDRCSENYVNDIKKKEMSQLDINLRAIERKMEQSKELAIKHQQQAQKAKQDYLKYVNNTKDLSESFKQLEKWENNLQEQQIAADNREQEYVERTNKQIEKLNQWQANLREGEAFIGKQKSQLNNRELQLNQREDNLNREVRQTINDRLEAVNAEHHQKMAVLNNKIRTFDNKINRLNTLIDNLSGKLQGWKYWDAVVNRVHKMTGYKLTKQEVITDWKEEELQKFTSFDDDTNSELNTSFEGSNPSVEAYLR